MLLPPGTQLFCWASVFCCSFLLPSHLVGPAGGNCLLSITTAQARPDIVNVLEQQKNNSIEEPMRVATPNGSLTELSCLCHLFPRCWKQLAHPPIHQKHSRYHHIFRGQAKLTSTLRNMRKIFLHPNLELSLLTSCWRTDSSPGELTVKTCTLFRGSPIFTQRSGVWICDPNNKITQQSKMNIFNEV